MGLLRFKGVAPDGFNKWHVDTGSNVRVAALEGTKRGKQRVQTFASF